MHELSEVGDAVGVCFADEQNGEQKKAQIKSCVEKGLETKQNEICRTNEREKEESRRIETRRLVEICEMCSCCSDAIALGIVQSFLLKFFQIFSKINAVLFFQQSDQAPHQHTQQYKKMHEYGIRVGLYFAWLLNETILTELVAERKVENNAGQLGEHTVRDLLEH
ncbi:hypothetical protein BpHYR1_052550 [Brachionus plicatilis]|uniref:Uncharacterized protein n=1 Tax=Brachionus plicatilis TaxID=10195 RepID=A0A3M7QZH8_BRAPC|nr:hypothetical protein BpHYR1_052550 [Brachionus plicatilis]